MHKTKKINSPNRIGRPGVAAVGAPAVPILGDDAAVLLQRVLLRRVFVPVGRVQAPRSDALAEGALQREVTARLWLQVAIVHLHVNNLHEFNLSSEFLNLFLGANHGELVDVWVFGSKRNEENQGVIYNFCLTEVGLMSI